MIKKLLTLKDEFIINSSVDLISKKLYAFNLFNIEEVNNHEYKVSSKISLGIGVINNMISSPISVFVTIVALEQNKSKAILATGLRIDLMLIIILSLIVFFTLLFYQIIKKEEIPFWL